MDRATVLGIAITKRGLVVTLVTVAAVLGAGLGYVVPALTDPASPGDSGETGIETTASADETSAIGSTTNEVGETTNERGEATDTVGEATTESQSRDGWNPPDGTTNRPETKAENADRTTENTRTTTSVGTDDDSDLGSSNDEEPDGDAESEINVTVGSLSDYPSNSLTLNAVVNAPNTASTAGGA